MILTINRIRKIKCDEDRPFCQRCVQTGRTCDGYESLFRPFISQPVRAAHDSGSSTPEAVLQPKIPPENTPTSQDVDLLNRHFTTKTIFDVELACDQEAIQILHASLNDPAIRHAVSSLRTLREDFETYGTGPASAAQQTPSFNHGLQQYTAALTELTSKMASPHSDALRSVLLCCQVFISIEQVRGDFGTMALHIIRGLGIMHEYRARPCFDAVNGTVVPAHHEQLPLLDVFVIKLFAAPCKFTEHTALAEGSRMASPEASVMPRQQPVKSHDLRTIAPNLRTKLVRISSTTLEFLAKVSEVESAADALRLSSERGALLGALASWLSDLETAQANVGLPGPEHLQVSFMRLFYLILRIVLLGALHYSPDVSAELQAEENQLQSVANDVGKRVRAFYRTSSGTSSG